MNVMLGLADLAGYVALLLWGTHMVTSGVQRGYGGPLRQTLGHLLKRGRSAFGAGLMVTLAIQSSTATSLMGASFVAEGLIGLETGYLMMLGANVGTALVARALSFPIEQWAPVALLAGFVLFRKSHTDRHRNLGRVAMGLGMMLLALHWLVVTLDSWTSTPGASAILSGLVSQPVLLAVGALLLTWVCHSSVAVILLGAAVMRHQGWPLDAQVAILLGANLGGAISPVLEAGSVEARRLPMGNLWVRGVGAMLVLVLWPVWSWIPDSWRAQDTFLVNAHVVFNLVLAALVFPFAKTCERLLLRALPSPVVPQSAGAPRYLDDANMALPNLAVAASEREVVRLTGLVEELMRSTMEALRQSDEGMFHLLRIRATEISRLALAIRHYLTRLPSEAESGDVARSQDIVRFLYDLEQMADLLVNGVVRSAIDQRKHRAAFSEEEWKLLEGTHQDLLASFHMAVAVFMKRDLDVARSLVARKPAFRDLELHTMASRVDALRQGDPVASRPGDALMVALRDFKRVHSHLTGVAYQVLEEAGMLRSRLVDEKMVQELSDAPSVPQDLTPGA